MGDLKGGAGRGVLLLACALMLVGCAQERIRRHSDQLLSQGLYEQSLQEVEQGLKDHPGSPVLKNGALMVRAEALTRLLAAATQARQAGRLDEAQTLLMRAMPFDSSGQRVGALVAELQIERRQADALAMATEAQTQGRRDLALRIVRDSLKENPRHKPLLQLQRQLEGADRQAAVKSIHLGLAEQRPISLDFRDANLRTVLDLVTRHSGVNFVLDKDVRSDTRITVLLKSVRVEDALDLITSTYGLSKKLIDSKTVLIYPNSPDKQREHQEQVIKVFHLASVEAKGAAAFLRSMMKVREPHVDERANLIALRDSPENVELAERLLALYDVPEPEVLLELEVIEVRTNRLLDLGIKPPDSFSLTLLGPNGSAGGLTWDNLRNIPGTRVGVGVGGVLASFKRELGDVNILANPSIRAKSKEKAKVMIGDKVPVITATTGQGGFVSDSVNYLDVGLKLEVEPTVFADDEVAIKIGLEVSNLAREVRTASGSLAYQIGTRNASTLLRLRDGETQLLAGLISKEDRNSVTGFPGLADLPLAGRLFSSTRDETQRTELVLAITPRLIRGIRKLDAAESELWVGTEAAPRLRSFGARLAELSDKSAPATPASPASGKGAGPGLAPVPSPGSAPASPGVAAAPQSMQGTGTLPVAASPLPVPDAAAAAAANSPDSSIPVPVLKPSVPVQLRWHGPSEVKRGQEFVLQLELNTPLPLRGAPMQLAFDKERLQVLEVLEGDFFKQGQGGTSFTQGVQASEGRINAGVLRTHSSGVSGRGQVLAVRIKALAAGEASVSLGWMEPLTLGQDQATLKTPVLHVIKVQ